MNTQQCIQQWSLGSLTRRKGIQTKKLNEYKIWWLECGLLKIDCRGKSSYMHILLFIMVVWSCNTQNDILNYNIVVNFKELNQKELNMMSECVLEKPYTKHYNGWRCSFWLSFWKRTLYTCKCSRDVIFVVNWPSMKFSSSKFINIDFIKSR